MLTSDDLVFFSAIARAPSLAAAARQLDVTPSSVTQRLQALERRLGVQLLHRSGRQLSLTDEGALLLDHGATVVGELAQLTDRVQARRGIVAGRLRVIAPLGFGRAHVAPLLHRFAARHPGLSLDVTLSDRLGRVPVTGWDVAVHIGTLADSSLRAHRLAPNARVLCAAPSLLVTHGVPDVPDDLLRFPCLVLRENDEDTTLWRFTTPRGPATVRIEPHYSSNDGEVIREWALAGAGVLLRSEWSVAADLAAGRLVRLLEDCTLPPADIMALVPTRTGRSARTSACVAFLREEFADVPWRRSSGGA
jgi:DNA-binding transcriptional LysR family regulator